MSKILCSFSNTCIILDLAGGVIRSILLQYLSLFCLLSFSCPCVCFVPMFCVFMLLLLILLVFNRYIIHT